MSNGHSPVSVHKITPTTMCVERNMLTSPITVTIDGTDHSLSRINQDNYGASYLKKAAGLEIRLNIRHSYEKSGPNGQYERHNVDLQYTTFDVDGNPTTTQSYAVLRTLRGKDPELLENVSAGLNAFVTANVAQIVAWES